VVACKQAGLLVKSAAPAQQQQQQAELGSAGLENTNLISWGDSEFSDEEQAGPTAASSGSLKQQQQTVAEGLELFDLLGQRSRLLPWVRSSGVAADREALSGADELRLITNEYHSYLCALLTSL
jgi:hypothetical protein